MKSIRRSLKDRDRQSPPSTAGSHSHSHSQHHILGNGSAGSAGAVLLPVAAPRGGMHGKTPPKKVIRAIASYRSQSPQELSFESGDFFHVVGERVDAAAAEIEWFDAANPLTGARGLVPARCFQILGRNEKENAAVAVAQHTRSGSMHSNAATLSPPLGGSGSGSQGHSSSQFHSQQQQQQQYGQRGNNSSTSLSRQSAGSNGTVPSPSSGTFPNGAGGSSRLSKPSSATTGSGSRAKTQPLYGVVQYDFVAERADELDAKKGESIIVIAQSNHEWFVAKPIGRLGGPGLIPVSFVAISDTTTGQPLPQEKVRDMIESGMVPPVEEWKKQTAEYKQASIPLGRFDFSNQSTPTLVNPSGGPQRTSAGSNVPYSSSNNPSATSLGSSGRPPSGASGPGSSGLKTFSPNSSTSSFHNTHQHQHHSQQQYQTESQIQQYTRHQQQSYDEKTPQPPANGQFASTSSAYPVPDDATPQDSYFHRQGQQSEGQGQEQEYEPTGYEQDGEVEDYYDKYGLVSSATVESFHSEEENFWFHLRVNFSQSGYSLILYRLYDDFYEFQCALMDEHPVEAGRELPAGTDARAGDVPRRIIPKMPGPVDAVDEVVCAQRVDDLTVYLGGLCALPDYLRADPLFYEFLVPRPGDVEAAAPDAAMRARWEAEKTRDRERDRELASSASGSRSLGKKLDEEVEEYLDQMGNVADRMSGARINDHHEHGHDLGYSKPGPGNLPPLSTHTASDLNRSAPSSSMSPAGQFAGYSMSSSAGPSGHQHARQPSTQQYRPPSSSGDSQGGGAGSYNSNGGPLSAGSGINFTSPFGASVPSTTSSSSATATSAPSAQVPASPFVKIKIFHRNTDDLIAIRVPPSINLAALLDKVRERLGGEVSHVRYRDEGNARLSQGQMQSLLSLPGGARLVELRNDRELDDWIKGAQRLVAYVD